MEFTYESFDHLTEAPASPEAAAYGKDYLRRYKDRFRYNVATTPPDEARAVAERMFAEAGLDLDDQLPDFDANYRKLHAKMRYALPIPRNRMPVIEPEDMAEFEKKIKAGHVDLFAPWADLSDCPVCLAARDRFPWQHSRPPMLGGEEGAKWITLGLKDGDPDDDKLDAKANAMRPVKELKPLQNQIWFDKCIASIIAWGVPAPGSRLAVSASIIVSSDNYILDGHHRYGQAYLTSPGFKLKCLNVPLDINELLKVGRAYGSAIGRRTKD